ncbi:DNA mismatch repair endonuclease MutL [Gluconobacter sphaericus]|uniref:DNA mismatch repair protein MutL n=1 Tax=Gluconobacter sphaericus NBRC 12467 TaxID=1307951 RepID=A0AA37SJX1_9PROT|nr:DNA mismatch repair endonuclease MutL [Gluconobacter sphaericus]MBF0885984.1 DNA mismatch repair endonuclease MutL [Gluconobacter sphaericus]GBR49892.1 DNA mismatch repair protein MutL [Gluconobacter sphaericus NBRC 12467]GEB42585.1 DNA mismatch repair protein MutL [Gluconobacter sphaericus NBRC 12467]GLQ85503.1 DNA mismatch repair protein MutL [Gluconobacter sphaericus NBRC 12467]
MSEAPSFSRPTIRRLSGHVIDLIAAGEVIERPAAALKELVENAIDSGATRIVVALRAGGTDRIDVTDNGCGMNPFELELAVERHCTSKLQDDHLVQIRTLGFRGEALPSIGASARLSITSRTPDADTAWCIRVDGGVITPPQPASGPVGTRIVVTDLFFATPARRKFLKSARVESGHAESVMRRLALSAPHCAMRVLLDDKVLFDLPEQSPISRAASILDTTPDTLIPLDEKRGAVRLSGFACGPARTRATGSGQFILVNNRPVTDPMLRTAIRVAYRPVIERGRFPVMALHLTVPLERLDVNVHPAKTELRFADEAEIRSLVIGGLGRALGHGSNGGGGIHASFGSRPSIVYPSRLAEPQGAPASVPLQGSLPTGYDPRPSSLPDVTSSLARQGFAETDPAFAPAARAPQQPEALDPAFPLGAAIAQVFDTYILALAPDGDLVLVDQHAAHERLTHERLREQYANGGTLRSQALLLPEVVDLPRREAEALMARSEDLSKLGIDLESFGPGSVLLRSVPALLGAQDIQGLLKDVADELASDPDLDAASTGSFSHHLDAILARMACHGSIRAGRRLKSEEMDALLREMELTPRANTCSHGRPTWLKLTRRELERLFGRVK